MNIHEAARKVLEMEELPDLKGCGLCRLLSETGAYKAYDEMEEFLHGWLPKNGVWTEQRLNVVCLLAITSPEDFL
jgi:hypothetical protein